MALSESERRELDEMLTALCESQLEDTQVEHLLQWLEEPDVQDCFVSHAMLDSELCLLRNGPKEISLPKEATSPAKTSPLLGFLDNLTHLGGSFTSMLWTLLALVSVIAFSFVFVVIRGIHVQVDGPEAARQNVGAPVGRVGGRMAEKDEGGRMKDARVASPFHPSSLIPHHPSAIARLVRAAGCRWTGQSPAPELNGPLAPGQSLSLTSGVAEIDFDIGAKLILQGPADLPTGLGQRRPIGYGQGHGGNQERGGPRLPDPYARGRFRRPGHRVRRRSDARRKQQGPRLQGPGRCRSRRPATAAPPRRHAACRPTPAPAWKQGERA